MAAMPPGGPCNRLVGLFSDNCLNSSLALLNAVMAGGSQDLLCNGRRCELEALEVGGALLSRCQRGHTRRSRTRAESWGG
jgi:hypothetical protein